MKKEITRKGIHILFGILILGIIIFLGVKTSVIILGSALIIGTFFSITIMRLGKPKLLKKIVEKVDEI